MSEGMRRMLSEFQGEVAVLRDALREKGVKHFARPIGLGLLAVVVSKHLVYSSGQAAIGRVQADLTATEATARYAADYMDLKARLAGLYSRLPDAKDPGQWLLDAVRESLREEGIIPTSFSTPMERAADNYRFVSISVACSASYKELASWIARLERSKSVLFIGELMVEKKTEPLGSNKVTISIATVVPMQREGM